MSITEDEEQQLDLDQFLSKYLCEFRPFAYWDKHLDCIRVQIRDCSVTETRVNRIFTVLKANHCDYDLDVGFTIKGVRHLFHEMGIPLSGVIRMSDLIHAIVEAFPEQTVKNVTETLSESDAFLDLEVDLNETSQEPEPQAA